MNRYTLARGVEKAAILSRCGGYRYTLTRRWDDGPACDFVMLNPSSADARDDDPTVRRCVAFAQGWGHPALVVTNLFAWRSTDPAGLHAAIDPVGPDNDRALVAEARAAAIVICAWGAHPAAAGRSGHVLALLRAAGARPFMLRMTGLGQPGHPLYLPKELTPIPMSEPEARP